MVSRAGKATGKYRYYFNILDEQESQPREVNWEKDVRSWEAQTSKIDSGSNFATPDSEVEGENEVEHVFLTSKLDKEVAAEAKRNELKNWADIEVYEIIHDDDQQNVSVKWVITQKTEKDVLKVKARLVARGFEEVGEIRNDSPTCMKESIPVALYVMVYKEWMCQSLDLKAAFLQGKTIDRNVFIKPPPEAGCKGYIWKLRTCVYDLVDASRIWYLRIKEDLLNLGMSISKYDPALFFWHCNEQLQGVLAVHVNDFYLEVLNCLNIQ